MRHTRDAGSAAAPTEAGIEIEHLALLTIGGGFGSLALVAALAARGVPTSSVGAVGHCGDPLLVEQAFAAKSGRPSVTEEGAGPFWEGRRQVFGDLRRSLGWHSAMRGVAGSGQTDRRDGWARTMASLSDRVGWPAVVVGRRVEWIEYSADGGYTVKVNGGCSGRLIQADHLHFATGPGFYVEAPHVRDYRSLHPTDVRVGHAFDGRGRLLCDVPSPVNVTAVHGDGRTADLVVNDVLRKTEDGCSAQVLHICGRSIPRSRVDARVGMQPEAPARRPGWFQRRLNRAAAEGRYLHVRADVSSIGRHDARLELDIETHAGSVVLLADRFIDAQGMRTGISAEPAVEQLLSESSASDRPERLPVDRALASEHLASGSGRCYVSGSLAEAPGHAAPDTPLALHDAARRISDDAARRLHLANRSRSNGSH